MAMLLRSIACSMMILCACFTCAFAQEAKADANPSDSPPGFVLSYELSYPSYVGANVTYTPGCTPSLLYTAMEEWSTAHGSPWDENFDYLVQWFDTEPMSTDSILVRKLKTSYVLNSDDPALLCDLIEATSNIEFCRLTNVIPLKFYYFGKFPEVFNEPHTVTVDGFTRSFPWNFTWEQQVSLLQRFRSRQGKNTPEWTAGDLTWLAGPDCTTTAYRVELDENDNLIITTIATEPLVPGLELPEVYGVTIPQQHSLDTDEKALRHLTSSIYRQYLPENQQEPGDGTSWVELDAFIVRVPLLPEELWQAALRGENIEIDPATRLKMTALNDELESVFQQWLLSHPELRDENGVAQTGFARPTVHYYNYEERDAIPLAFCGRVYTARQEIKDELMALMRASQDVHEPLLCRYPSARRQRDWPPTV